MKKQVHLVEKSPQWTEILGIDSPENQALKALCHELSFVDPRSRGSRTWSGVTSLVQVTRRGGLRIRVPTGLAPHTAKEFSRFGYEVQLTTLRPSLRGGKVKLAQSFRLYEFQKRAIRSWYFAGGRGGISVPMGAGKSSIIAPAAISLGLTSRAATKAIFLCERLDILFQSREKLSEALGYEVGVIGGGEAILRPVTVATVQSLNSAWGPKDENDFFPAPRRPRVIQHIADTELWVFDEYHHLQSDQYATLMQESRTPNSWFRMGLSGTPVSTMGADLKLDALVGPIVEDIPYRELIDHVPPILSKPTFIVDWVPRQRLEVEPYKNHPASKYAAFYRAYITQNMWRNERIKLFTQRKTAEGKSVAILVTKLEHGKILEEMIPGSVFVHGGWSADRRAAVWKALIAKKQMVVISTLIREALDIPSLNCTVYACAGDSEVGFPQSWRCMRSDGGKKTECEIYTFRDYQQFFSKQSEEQLKMMNRGGFTVRHINRPKHQVKTRDKARRRRKLVL